MFYFEEIKWVIELREGPSCLHMAFTRGGHK